jgi:hypothetical protein
VAFFVFAALYAHKSHDLYATSHSTGGDDASGASHGDGLSAGYRRADAAANAAVR